MKRILAFLLLSASMIAQTTRVNNLAIAGTSCWNSDSGITRQAAKSFNMGSCTPGDQTGTLNLNTINVVTLNVSTTLSLPNLTLPSAGVLKWSTDAGLSRTGAGIVAVGNGTQGDITGTLNLAFVKLNSDSGLSRTGTGVVGIGNGTPGDITGTLNAGFIKLNTDSGVSRISAGVVGIGNGTSGDTTGNLQFNLISKMNGFTTVAGGAPAIVAQVNSGTLSAAQGITTFFTEPGGKTGMYRVSYSIIVTAVGTGGTITLNVLSNNGTAASQPVSINSVTTQLGAENGSGNTSTPTFFLGAGQVVQWQVLFTAVLGSPSYVVRLRLEYLG